jgi:hypothetical protein
MSPESPSSPLAELLAAASIGCAAGLLVAGRLRDDGRRGLALTLAAAGLVAALPAAVQAAKRLARHPESVRGSRRRWVTIRDAAIPEEAGIYDER